MNRSLVSLLVVPALLAGCGHAMTPTASTRAASTAAVRDASAPASLTKIRSLAAQALAAAAAQTDWDARATTTNQALQQIQQVPLADASLTNLAAHLATIAVSGYGYIGFKPSAESRYKVQAVALQALQSEETEASLAKGAQIFTLSAQMAGAATDYNDGVKVGISLLMGIRDFYKDSTISHAASAALDKAHRAADKPTCYQLLVDGLKQIGAGLDR